MKWEASSFGLGEAITLQQVRQFENKLCSVDLSDQFRPVEAIVRPLTRTSTAVGDKVVHNWQICSIETVEYL